MRTRNLDEAIAAVAEVYCPHTIQVVGPAREIDACLTVESPTSQPLVTLSYSTAVDIDALNFSGLFLVMHCARGAAAATQEKRTAEWRMGQTMPFSAGFDTTLSFDQTFAQKSIRLDVDRLEAQCARWLGHPLEQPLRFDLSPFSDELEQIWRWALSYLEWSENHGPRLTEAAKTAFDEFLLTLLLHHHPHNYSEEMARERRAPVPGLIRRAERFMSESADKPITVSDVAGHLGVSLRTLQAGFRHWRNATPTQFLRAARLGRVRDELLRAGDGITVTNVAISHGFSHLGRFSAQYAQAFGELPRETLRRGQSAFARPK